MPEKWSEVRADAIGFLEYALEDLVPSDHIFEHAEKVNWAYWDTASEYANAAVVLTRRVATTTFLKQHSNVAIFQPSSLVTAKAKVHASACLIKELQ